MDLHIIIHFLIYKGFIASFLATMWDHMDGFTKQYRCESSTYLISCNYFEFLSLFTYKLVNQAI